MQLISRKTTIEDLVEIKPGAINYLSKKGIRCIRCGEPIWGPLEEAARLKGFTNAELTYSLKN